MSQLDAKVVDEYARHLSKVNARNTVLVNEDIYNEQGALLVKKGAEITESLADKIIKHKLTQPLEHSISLSNQIDSGRLYKAFQELFASYPDCEAVHEASTLEILLRDQCREYARYPLLTQKLTVLAMRRPKDFRKAVFCAWLSLALARQMKLSEQEIRDAFLAGLMHDVGMLHISLDILDKSSALSADEWRTIQSHPLITDLFLRQVPGLPKGVARGALEHHERIDGTGYPVGMFAEKISVVGQVVAMADSICAIRVQRFQQPDSNLANLVPILQFNVGSFGDPVYRAAVAIIRAGQLHQARLHSDEQIPELSRTLLDAYKHLEACFEVLASLVDSLPEDQADKRVRTACLQVQNSWMALVSSGLLTHNLKLTVMRASSGKEPELNPLVDELHLMLGEVVWQFGRLRKVLNELASDRGSAKFPEQLLHDSLGQMAQLDQVKLH